MKNQTTALLLPVIAAIIMATGGCSLFHHHQPKSSWKIIQEGDRNPFITETPQETVDTPTRKIEVQTSPVNPQ